MGFHCLPDCGSFSNFPPTGSVADHRGTLVQAALHGPGTAAMPIRRGRKMADRVFNVLFLCTGNSARSIIAECILNRLGSGTFHAFSAGSHPRGEVHPYALDVLRHENHDVSALRSKSWEEFGEPGAPEFDFVFTVCDDAASEVCPVWPGQPMTAHWGIPDPAAVDGREAEMRLAFADAMRMLTQRISIFVSLPIESLDRMALQERLDAIGGGQRTDPAESGA
jgi:protein-tyrosine-phosphatase